MDFSGLINFVKALYLDSFVDKDNGGNQLNYGKNIHVDCYYLRIRSFDKNENKKRANRKNFSKFKKI